MDCGDVPTWLGVVGGFVAFAIGLRQYREAQTWKRLEFVAAEMEKFFGDPRVATALLLIDYYEVRLDADGRRAPIGTTGAVVYTDAKLREALRDHTVFARGVEEFTDDQMLAREAFDTFFTGIERFRHYRETGLIQIADLTPYLRYWLEALSDPAKDYKDAAFYPALHRFLEAYYGGVLELMRELGLDLPDTEAKALARAPKATSPAHR